MPFVSTGGLSSLLVSALAGEAFLSAGEL